MFAFPFTASQSCLERERSPAVSFSQGNGEALEVSSKGKRIQLVARGEGLKMQLRFWPAVRPRCGSVGGESCFYVLFYPACLLRTRRLLGDEFCSAAGPGRGARSGLEDKALLESYRNLLEGIEAVGRAGGTDPRLSPRPDAGNAAKRKFRFLPELDFGARVRTMPLSENTGLLRSVFLQVPEIISSIRQAGKIARQEEFQNNLSDVEDPFAKKFEVLFCGRVTVAHKNAPPALIDECIEKFNRASCTQKSDFNSLSQQHETANSFGGFSFSNKFRSVFQPLVSEEEEKRPIRKSFSQPGLRSFAFKKDLQEGSHRSNSFVRSFEEDAISLNLRSQLIYGHSVVQPTDIAENRTMLFTIGQSEVYLISPDTKKVAIEKSFKEISFCSQGIRHVDHFGFICRESSENGGFHFVCYVFQCTDEALVDEIMMTLKQAFTVAAVQQTAKAQPQLCEGCPMQNLHKLCEKIEGLHPSKTKLELQKHLTTLNNQEQASVFEEVKKLRPRNDQKENELVISVLRNMYEEKQKDHVHVGEAKQTSQPPAENAVNEVPSSAPRFRLDMLKNKAKRSLTESFESILSRGSKARGPLDSSGAVDLDSSMSSNLSSTSK
ncbi:PREDICTED: TBC1 domain family member 1-like, partial [Tauraco erythrolophus]|uniref:TBC1 domain family member 1-like n=1 Tax=Tauraco erythrolophus TaxID=121530 RepID=UPI000523960F